MNEELFSGDTVTMDRFRWGIEALLNGINPESSHQGSC